MNNSLITLICALIFAGLIILINFLYPLKPRSSDSVATSDEEAEVIATARQNFITALVETFCDAWRVDPGDFTKIYDILGYNGTRVQCIYKNVIIRFYINWEKHTLRVCYTMNCDEKTYLKHKTYHFKTFVSFTIEKLYQYLQSLCLFNYKQMRKIIDNIDADTLKKILSEAVKTAAEMQQADSDDLEERPVKIN